MEFVAKPVLEDKFWILEDNGQKVGTIRSNENGVTLQVGSENQTFKALEELTGTNGSANVPLPVFGNDAS